MRFVSGQVRLIRLLARYFYLHVYYIYLRIYQCLLKVAGAALVEAAKMEYCIKSLSKEDRVIFAACIAVSIYVLALFMVIRI